MNNKKLISDNYSNEERGISDLFLNYFVFNKVNSCSNLFLLKLLFVSKMIIQKLLGDRTYNTTKMRFIESNNSLDLNHMKNEKDERKKYGLGVFSRRFSSEKSPTITVASLFSFFFVRLQSHSDWSTFLTIETTKTTKTIRPSPVSGN